MAQGVVVGHSFFPPWNWRQNWRLLLAILTYTATLHLVEAPRARGSPSCTCNHAVLHRHRPASLACFRRPGNSSRKMQVALSSMHVVSATTVSSFVRCVCKLASPSRVSERWADACVGIVHGIYMQLALDLLLACNSSLAPPIRVAVTAIAMRSATSAKPPPAPR
jgi:hypothetical protein